MLKEELLSEAWSTGSLRKLVNQYRESLESGSQEIIKQTESLLLNSLPSSLWNKYIVTLEENNNDDGKT